MREKTQQPTPVNFVADLTSLMWEKMVVDPCYRCLIPVTHFGVFGWAAAYSRLGIWRVFSTRLGSSGSSDVKAGPAAHPQPAVIEMELLVVLGADRKPRGWREIGLRRCDDRFRRGQPCTLPITLTANSADQ
jgi:hypothetical protein